MIKEKRHYLLVECTKSINANAGRDFGSALQDELLRCIGEIDYHVVNPKYERSEGSSRFIISGTVEGMSKLIVALAMIKKVNGIGMAMFTLKRSGTVTGLMSGAPES
ncbi:MAG: Rpp14/Pop5 family protein [Candidatus Marsarchaeota archaeon]|nr:Rpp14/Pop5 family protein [Candidatus Marsarchaeota archaeon]MCL5112659.1 Rpp14/Pop5 family protein [Candidatus Marsarchaeota archaeon]